MRSIEESVFWHVYRFRYRSRSDLAAYFEVSAPTISRVVDDLLKKGLVVETKSAQTRHGRRPQLLEVTPDLATLLGIEIDRDRVTAAVTDISGTLLGRGSVKCKADAGVHKVIKATQRVIRTALADAGVAQKTVRGVGVGHPGVLDLEDGVVAVWPGVIGWREVPLRQLLHEALGSEVTIDDRPRAIALAERSRSPQDWEHANAAYVHIGTGVGAAIFVEGRLLRGSSQTAGEIGHVIVDPSGPPCSCDHRGCVEAFASSAAVTRRVRQIMKQEASGPLGKGLRGRVDTITIESLSRAINRGDPIALAAVQQAATALGLGISSLVQLLNPSLIVLCGRLARAAGSYLLNGIREVVYRQCFDVATRKLVFRTAPARKDISAVGCGLLRAEAEANRIIRERLYA